MGKGVGGRVLCVFRTDSGCGCGEEEAEPESGFHGDGGEFLGKRGTSTQCEHLPTHAFTSVCSLFCEHTPEKPAGTSGSHLPVSRLPFILD